MKSAATASHAEKAIVIAGLLCGVLDGIAAAVLSHSYGGTTMRMFQGIARGVLGTSALKGGVATALLGVALHFLIAFGAAAVYYLASRYIHVLIDRALICGVLYGAAIHLFMTFVVIPLSKIGHRPIVPRVFLWVLAIHMVIVGPSISLAIRRYSR